MGIIGLLSDVEREAWLSAKAVAGVNHRDGLNELPKRG